MNYIFELRKDKINKNNLIPIRVVINSNKIKIRKNLPNVKTLLEDWDSVNVLIKNNKKHQFYVDYLDSNKEINKVKEKIDTIFNFFKFNNIEFSEKLFLEKYNKDEVSVGVDFFDSFEDFIRGSKHTKTEGTIKRYITLRNFLLHFSTATKYPVRFDTINLNFEEEFMNYAFEERKTLNNYYGKLISIIKTFMNWSFNRGLHNNLEFKKIKHVDNEIEVIFLDKDELISLYEFNFENNKLSRARDFFCFGCFTGLRYSDIYNLHKANINDRFIDLNIIKTRTVSHRVELNKYSKALLNKYNGSLHQPIPKFSSQKLNDYIKECCKIVGIDKEVTITRYIGKKRIEKTFKKYELITCHISRKTFVTNSLLMGMNERVLRDFTNHSSERSFKKYVKLTNALKQQEMKRTWDENF